MSRVLFVSHDADLRAVAARVLTREGFDVTTAPHGGHALIACIHETFDALVVEDRLPEGPGAALAATLARHCPGLRLVRMGTAAARHVEQGDGVLLRRPFTADDLLAAIATAAVPSAS
ncbi:MAG: hypothetical protein ACRD1V_14275 [Vicinamibacterales bacterium]